MESITRKKIEETCLETIAKEMGLKAGDLNEDMKLRDDLDIVSLDAMNIINIYRRNLIQNTFKSRDFQLSYVISIRFLRYILIIFMSSKHFSIKMLKKHFLKHLNKNN